MKFLSFTSQRLSLVSKLMFFALIAHLTFIPYLTAQQLTFQREMDTIQIIMNGSPVLQPFSGGMSDSKPALADIDNDGDLDLFVGRFFGRLHFYRNTGSAAASAFSLETERFVSPDPGNRSAPSFVDIDNDGDLDLFVGESAGNLNFYRNTGTATQPSFIFEAENFGSIQVGSKSVPTFADIDNDGDLDLFVGEDDGNINFYRNTGSVTEPEFTSDEIESLVSIDVGSASTPHLADIDADGDMDLFMGEGIGGGAGGTVGSGVGGNINFYRNTGTPTDPIFTPESENLDSIAVGGDSAPTLADIDNDGDLDLVVGEGHGNLNVYRNRGTTTNPTFTRTNEDLIAISFDVGTSSAPAFADIDNDGDFDLFVGERGGSLNFYRNSGTTTQPIFTFEPENYADVSVRSTCDSRPSLTDIDNDGDFDLFLGDCDRISYYKNTGTAAKPAFSLETTVFADIVFGANRHAFADIDNDGDLDLFLGHFNPGTISFYRNTGSATNPEFALETENFASIDVEFDSAPTFIDIDSDGDLDLFAGEQGGNINFFRNTGTPEDPLFILETETFASVSAFVSAPTFADIDNDGDSDLFVGELNGGLQFFRNVSPRAPVVLNPIADTLLTVGVDTLTQDLNLVFIDPNQDVLIFSALISNDNIVTGAVSGSLLVVTPISSGAATISVAADDGIHEPVSTEFIVTVNAPPILTNTIPDTSLSIQSSGFSISLEQFFEDSDNDPLFYSHTVSDTAVLVVSLSASQLTIQPRGIGAATIAVTATDTYATTSDRFKVKVKANTAPQITHSALKTASEKQAIAISAVISDDFGLASATLNFRRGGELSWSQEVMNETDGSYQATIPGNSVASQGVEYFIETMDTGGLDDREPAASYFSIQVSVADLAKTSAQPGGSEQTAYRLISIPLDLDDKSPSAVLVDDLGKYDDTKWRFFELRAGETYAEFPNTSGMEPGKAFWLIVKDRGKTIDSGPGKSNPTDEPFTLSLRPGWNLIGNPFNFAVPLTNISLANGDSVQLRRYTGSWNDPSRSQVLDLAPFEGYALFNNSNALTTLSIDPDLTSPGGLFKENSKRALQEESSWSIQISARCQQARDVDNIALAVFGASDEWDAKDSPEPPMIGEYVSIYFPHTEWGKPTGKFCTDARSTNTEGIAWNFEVVTNIRDKVKLTFQQLEKAPEELQVWLLDEAAHVSQNLRKNKVYDVAGAGREHPKRLNLVVGKSDFVQEQLRETLKVPNSFELFQNFPNPFNPSTTIRYGLPKQETVTLTIFNILGGEVVRLVNDQLKQPGYHAAVWDGRDHSGRAVASGVFFMRLQAGRFVQVGKMVMIQ